MTSNRPIQAAFAAAACVFLATSGMAAAQPKPLPAPQGLTKSATVTRNGSPVTGPLQVGDIVSYVLEYDPAAWPAAPASISDQLSAGQTLVPGSIVAPGWSWAAPDYAGNQETFNRPSGAGVGVSISVPIQPLGSSSQAGDGFAPVVVGSGSTARAFGVFHHQLVNDPLKIMCWKLSDLTACPGYPADTNSSAATADRRPTPMVDRAAAATDGKIYYPSASYDPANQRNIFGMGCWNTVTNAPCPFKPLDAANAYYTGPQLNGDALSPYVAGVIADRGNPNRVYMYAAQRTLTSGKVYCFDVSGPSPVACSWASSGALANSQWTRRRDIIFDEGVAQNRLYVHYGPGQVACIRTDTIGAGASCWTAAATGTDDWSTLSPVMANTGSGMTGVCLHVHVSVAGPSSCFSQVNGAAMAPPSHLASNRQVMAAFRIPGTQKVLYPAYTGAPFCYDFALGSTGGLCTGFAATWTISQTQDYGYAMDPSATDGQQQACLLGLGNRGRLWRFRRDGSVANVCAVLTGETAVNVNDLFCAKKPEKVQWNSVTLVNRDPNLTGGTISLIDSAGNVLAQVAIGSANTYSFGGVATGPGVTVRIQPLYANLSLPHPPVGLQLDFTPDVKAQICYKTKLSCGAVWNKAEMTSSGLSASAGVELGGVECAGDKIDIAVAKTRNEKGDYQIEVRNVGGAINAPAQIKVLEIVPANMTITGVQATGWICTPMAPSPPGLPLTGPAAMTCVYSLSSGSIPAGGSLPPIILTPKIDGEETCPNCVRTWVERMGPAGAWAPVTEESLTNNQACEGGADISARKRVIEGGFRLSAINDGPGSIYPPFRVVLTELIPSPMLVTGVNAGPGWTCQPPAGSVTSSTPLAGPNTLVCEYIGSTPWAPGALPPIDIRASGAPAECNCIRVGFYRRGTLPGVPWVLAAESDELDNVSCPPKG